MPWVRYASQHVNDQSRYPEVIAVSVILCVLMLAAVVGRAILRKSILGRDDFVVFVAAAFSVAYTVMTVIQTRYGLGLPIAARPEETARTFSILSYAGKPWYQLSLGAYKLALCLGYLRFLEGTSFKHYRWVIISSAAFCVITQLAFVLINLLGCTPVEKNFDRDAEGTCLPFRQTQYPMASIGIAQDVLVFLLPIPLFLRLSIDRSAILGLVFLFSCGLVTTICGIVRATYLKEVGPDGTGDNTTVVLMGCVETNVGIIMASLPFLRAFLKRIVNTVRDRTIAGHGSGRTAYTQEYNLSVLARSHEKDRVSTQVYGQHWNRGHRKSLAGSEEAILDDGPFLDSSQGILKTTSYKVESAEDVVDMLESTRPQKPSNA